MAKKGRPSKLSQISLAQVESLAAFGHTEEEIALILDICDKTLYNWKKNPEFLRALKRGKLKADLRVAQTLYEKAIGGDTTAIIFWLKNRERERWNDRHSVEHSGGVSLTVVSAVPRPEENKK